MKSIKNNKAIVALKMKLLLGSKISTYPSYYFCSFQKSGRTWLRFLIGNYYNIKYNLNLEINFHTIYSLLPSLSDKKRINTSYNLLSSYRLPLVYFTHETFNPHLFQKEKTIFMLRSVYDTIVSFYFHNAKHHQRYNENISSFIRDSEIGVKKWINYINSWSPALLSDKYCIVTYENNYENTFKLFSKVLNYLNIEIDNSIIKKTIELSSFNSMKKSEIKIGIINHKYDRNNSESRRMRKGGVGTYLDYLNSEDILYIKDQLDKNLNFDSKELLSKYYKKNYR